MQKAEYLRMNLTIPILLGTSREGRYSEHAAKFVLAEATKYGFTSQLIDPRDFLSTPVTNSCMTEERSAEWQRIMNEADGLIVVSPEYNHSYPGEVKMMLDELEVEYHRKPLAICGVSSGGIGGARMVEALHQVGITLQMANMKNSVYFSNCEELFKDGVITDPSYAKRLEKLFDELTWWAEALKTARSSA